MAFVSPQKIERYGYDFIPSEYLPPGKDEYWLRDRDNPTGKAWRGLKPAELEVLIRNGNTCSDWDRFVVSDPFEPSLIRNSNFYGLVRVGAIRKVLLQHHDFCIPAGIRNSTIISCDIGDDTAIQDCSYISHYIIGDGCMLSRIDEMQTTNHSKFGSGSLKDGEDEALRVWIDVMNEAGGRSILAFPEMTVADACLWACYRDDTGLTGKLKDITQKEYGGFRGSYGVVGPNTVIKSCNFIKDVRIGEWAYIKGANKLKNLSILSSKDEPTQIGEGVEMVNGIVGYGCLAFYGIKAVRFVMGRCSALKYGGRLIHSVLGDNSTVSCCEILNNLIFPCHEQHHNNSFLIASLIGGASNMAAGATVGSNHNSRANDGEIRAARGFWPGLSATLKHPSRFASFMIIAKGDYPYELNITYPFSLVNNNTILDRLEIMPAYFWMYNLYALERNSWKLMARDRRKVKAQHIEYDYLAPDTAEEIVAALARMEPLLQAVPAPDGGNDADGFSNGNEDPEYNLRAGDDAVTVTGQERHTRSTVLLKPRKAWGAYRDMLLYYSLKTLAEYLEEKPDVPFAAFTGLMEEAAGGGRVTEWVNLGGQIAPAFRVDDLRRRIRQGETASWKDIHAYYDRTAGAYPLDKARHAWEIYRYLDRPASLPGGGASPAGTHPLADSGWFKKELDTLTGLRGAIAEQVYVSRAKDFDDPFRGITFRNREEMENVAGTAGGNVFVKFVRSRVKVQEESVKKLQDRL